MKIDNRSEDAIFAMSGIRGKNVVNPHKLPFSFYFSSGCGVAHDIHVKPVFDPVKLRKSMTGTLKLCDDWEYKPGHDDKNVDQDSVNEMKAFFRKYLVLFCAVWDEQMQDATLEDYLKGEISFFVMLKDLDFYAEGKEELDKITTVDDLEQFCRQNSLVNMHENQFFRNRYRI